MGNAAHLQYIEELGKKLYAKIMEVESITEQDCIDYMKELVINRTYEGYNTEIQTIYGQLAVLLNQEILAAPDEWDRLYNVDFYIKIGENHIGLQIKPINNHLQIPEIHKEYALQAKTHEKTVEKIWRTNSTTIQANQYGPLKAYSISGCVPVCISGVSGTAAIPETESMCS